MKHLILFIIAAITYPIFGQEPPDSCFQKPSYYEASMLSIKYWESYKAKDYKCQADVKTIAWGETDKERVKMKYVPLDTANAWIFEHYDELYCIAQERYPMVGEQQHHAIVSLLYNLGKHGIGPKLDKAIREGRCPCEEIKAYKYAAGKVSNGLMNRRDVECILYCGTREEVWALIDKMKKGVTKKIIREKKKYAYKN